MHARDTTYIVSLNSRHRPRKCYTKFRLRLFVYIFSSFEILATPSTEGVPPLPFPAFTPISARVSFRTACEKFKPTPTTQPTKILIFGWGDGIPKHVSKYAHCYNGLFPSARIMVVLSRTCQASSQCLQSRVKSMIPVIDLVFPTPEGSGKEEGQVLLHPCRILAVSFLVLQWSVAYQKRRSIDRRFPHKLLVFDSAP